MTVKDCNASVTILGAYYLPRLTENQLPEYVDIMVQIGRWSSNYSLSIKALNARDIQKKCPYLQFSKPKAMVKFDEALISELINGLADGSIEFKYYFTRQGATTLPDGSICFIRGSELLGLCDRPYMVAPEISDIKLLGEGNSLPRFLYLLISSPHQVLLVFAYVILSSIRSLLINSRINLQAVLYIVGGQGLGKTTLATRIAGIYKKGESTVGIIQAGSTLSAANDIMTTLRDQPMIVDDLCLSVSRDTARKRVELASKLIRQSTGSIPIIKKSGKNTVELPCGASLILTAEFHLENMSDLTRCIIVPIQSPLDIPDELTYDLIGDAVRHYSLWLTDHIQEELEQFRKAVDDAVARRDIDARIATNYACLRSAFQSFIRSLPGASSRPKMTDTALNMMDKALKEARKSHQAMIEQIKDTIPVGNLSYCILGGYWNDAFDLTKKLERLKKHDGIIWKDDLCVRPEALIHFVRQQPGYHDWSPNRITRALKDINALVLQEEGTATVRLSKEKGVPRVYRIRLNILKETQKRY